MTDQLDELFVQEEEKADGGDQWSFEETPEIRGILTGVNVAPSAGYGPYFVLQIKTKDLGSFGIPVWGAVMNGRIDELAPKIGFPIGIRFDGEKKNKAGDRTYKSWTIVSTESDFEAWVPLHATKNRKRQPNTISQGVVSDAADEDYF